VLVEGESKIGEGQLFGRSTWNRIVNFSGPTELAGRLVMVKITKAYRNSLLGELVETG
jgi:tRNA-2-methylthio-N6-dimethylallyladenosine synthase